jgi:hypothetical protein
LNKDETCKYEKSLVPTRAPSRCAAEQGCYFSVNHRMLESHAGADDLRDTLMTNAARAMRFAGI